MTNSIYKGIFNQDKEYPSFSVVTYNDLDTESTVAVQVLMISTQPVPAGSDIKDANYWLPYNVENVNMLGAKSGIGYDEVAKMIEESLVDIKADIETLKQKVATLEQEQEALNGTVEVMNGELTNVKDSVTNLDTEIAGVQADVLELKNKPAYSLPVATKNRLGGIIIGSGLNIDEFGRVSVTGGSGGSGEITVDDRISSISENPVQNKAISKYLEPVLGVPKSPDAIPTVDYTFTPPKYESPIASAYFLTSDGKPRYVEAHAILQDNIDIKFGVFAYKYGNPSNPDDTKNQIALFVRNGNDNDIPLKTAINTSSVGNKFDLYDKTGTYDKFAQTIAVEYSNRTIGKNEVAVFVAPWYLSKVSITNFLPVLSTGYDFEIYNITPKYIFYGGHGYANESTTTYSNIATQPTSMNITINGAEVKSPWEQIQEDVERLKNKTLPIASASTLGGVKIGEGLSVTEDGTISVKLGTGLQFDENGNIVIAQ